MIYLIIWLTPIFLIPLLVYWDMKKGQSLEDYASYNFGDAIIYDYNKFENELLKAIEDGHS